MASGKGADSAKSTNFGLLGFPPFRRSQRPEIQEMHRSLQVLGFCGGGQRPEIQEIHRGLGHGFRKRSGLYKIDQLRAFVGFPPPFQRPEVQKIKHGTLQNRQFFRQILGFCGVPSISVVPDAGNPENPQGPGKWLRKRSGLGEIDNFAFRRPPATGNPENPGGLRTLWGVIYKKRV